MAPIGIKYIVSFSSQDDLHRANNLIGSDGSKRWLSHPKDRSGKLELILELEKACQFAYIDIGTIWCANLEIRVGCSDWPQSAEFKSLLPTINLMSPLDCNLKRATTSIKMFSKADFSKEITLEKWDRVQLICRQPFRKDMQFGISFIRIKDAEQMDSGLCTKEDKSPETKKTQDVNRIYQHFFGDDKEGLDVNSINPSEVLKYRLMKMAGSTENGSDHENTLSRTAKIVLKATEMSPKQTVASPQPKRGLFSNLVATKNDLPFEVDVKNFLSTLKLSIQDLDSFTVADIRHKFERKKRRKLTTEEKREFSDICQNFICDLFESGKCSLNVGLFRSEEPCETSVISSNGNLLVGNQKITHAQIHCDKRDRTNEAFMTPPSKKSHSVSSPYSPTFTQLRNSSEKSSSKSGATHELTSHDDHLPAHIHKKNSNKSRTHPQSPECERVNFDLNVSNLEAELQFEKSGCFTVGDTDNDSFHLGKIYKAGSCENSNVLSTPITSNKSKKKRLKIQENEDEFSEIIKNYKKKSGKSENAKRLKKDISSVPSKKELYFNLKDRMTSSVDKNKPSTSADFQIESSKNAEKRKTGINSSELETTICDKCFAMYPKGDIGTHYVFCLPATQQEVPGHANCNELVINDTIDYMECPICLDKYPQDVLLVHASECGL